MVGNVIRFGGFYKVASVLVFLLFVSAGCEGSDDDGHHGRSSPPVNHAPQIVSTPIGIVYCDSTYYYPIDAIDEDGDALSYSLVTAPEGMVINSLTGVVSWKLTLSEIGDYNVEVMVSDGKAEDHQDFLLTILPPPNHAPTITSTPVITATSGIAYGYAVTATDIDGDALSYSLAISPAGMTINILNGNISWLPVISQVGSQTVKVAVGDGKITVYQQFTINVSLPPNHAPTITSTPIITATSGIAYAYAVTATDLDGDALSYSLAILPAGMTINSSNGNISWLPAISQVGSQTVKVVVSDGKTTVYQQFTITVYLPPNHAPSFTSSPITIATSGTAYNYQATGTDVDGNSLIFSLQTYPAGMTINSSSGLVSWPSPVVGSYTTKLSLSDGNSVVYQQYTLVVSPQPNRAPVITSSPITTATSGVGYGYNFTATDADGDMLIYSLSISPSGMTINSGNGVISWTPTKSQVGAQSVKVGVSDGKTTVYQQYTVTVSLGVNHGPVITSTANRNAIANILYGYTVTATDADYDTLTYTLATKPTGMTINSSNGRITWTATTSQVGNEWIQVNVSDGFSTVNQKYAIRVIPTNNGIPFMRGCNLVSWWYTDYTTVKVEETLRQMKYDGCDTVSVLVTWYQDTTTSTVISSNATKTPTDAGITHVVNYAHSLGMRVFLKPHVDLNDGNWRGMISMTTESNWTAWFNSFNAFTGHYLDLARTLNCEGFVIGTEYVRTQSRSTNWRSTISIARGKFSGLLTYSANHDDYQNVPWWDALDFIGISAYFPLTSSNSPSINDLNAAWAARVSSLSSLASTWHKDIVFLEIGYTPRDGTNKTPWDSLTYAALDAQEQSDCYEAAFESVYDQTWFKGMSWWMWTWNPTQYYFSFDVYGHPAEYIERWWYAGY